MAVYGINQTELALGDSWIPAAKRDAVLQGIKDIGAQYVRIGCVWQSIQPGSGLTNLAWGPMDAALNKCSQVGLIPLLVIQFPAPYWSNSATDFGTFAKLVAQRYGPSGTNQCALFEIMNEQNSAANLSPPTPVAYLPYLKAAFTGIKSVFPVGSTVITGGVMSTPTDIYTGFTVDTYEFIKGIYTGGGKAFFDAIGYHWYSQASGRTPGLPYGQWQEPTTTQDFYIELTQARDLMVAQGDTAKQIWVTEIGVPQPTLSAATCAAWLSQQMNLLLALNYLGPTFIYNYMNSGNDTSNINNQWGLVDYNLVKKQPVYSAIAQFNAGLSGRFTVAASMSAAVHKQISVLANFSAAASLQAPGVPRQTTVANFSAQATLSGELFGRPTAELSATATMSCAVHRQYACTATMSATAAMSGVVAPAYPSPPALMSATAAMSAVVGKQNLFSYDFTGTGSTKPTSLFTDFGQGYAVASSEARASAPASDGYYYSGGIYKLDQTSADHFSEIHFAPGSGSVSGDRSNIPIVRSDNAGANWVGGISHWSGSSAYAIVTCIAGVVTVVRSDPGTSPLAGDAMRLTADGNVYTLTVTHSGVTTTVCTWTDVSSVFTGAANLRTGFGFQHVRSGGVHYQAPGIGLLWRGADVRPLVVPAPFPAGFAATASMSAVVLARYSVGAGLGATAAMSAAVAIGVAANFAAAAAMSAVPSENHPTAADFAAAAAMSATVGNVQARNADMSATAAMTADTLQSFAVTAGFSAAASMTVARGEESHSVAAAFASTAALSGTSVESHAVMADMAAAAAMTAEVAVAVAENRYTTLTRQSMQGRRTGNRR